MSTPISITTFGSQTITVSGDYGPVAIDRFGDLDIAGIGVSTTLSGLTINAATIRVIQGASATIENDPVNTGSSPSIFEIGTNAKLEEGAALTAIQPVSFLTSNGTLIIDTIGQSVLDGFITPYGSGDTIRFPKPVTSFSYTPALFGNEGTLVVDNGMTVLATLAINGLFTAQEFGINGDGSLNIACFAAGTRLTANDGDVAVEDIVVGDRVRTLIGDVFSTVGWIGRRRVDCRRHPRPESVWPVRIMAGAFADGVPERDLWVSPDHAVYADGVLIPVKYLVDGVAVRQVPVADVTYFHVELDRHDVVLAEGLPVESLLPGAGRSAFEGNATALHPDFCSRAWDAAGCAPLAVGGPVVATVRARLEARWPMLERAAA